eukprot:201522-Prymnesium_polylepis.1
MRGMAWLERVRLRCAGFREPERDRKLHGHTYIVRRTRNTAACTADPVKPESPIYGSTPSRPPVCGLIMALEPLRGLYPLCLTCRSPRWLRSEEK